MRAFLDGKKYVLDDWDDTEPANMVVALGHDPLTGSMSRFYEFIPCTTIRDKDKRSIIVFDVELGFTPYVSPMSGGIAYRVKKSEKSINIQLPDDGCIYPPSRTHPIEWTLFEVHIGTDPEFGLFVGVMLERNCTNPLNGNVLEYMQWSGDIEHPALFYGMYPNGWLDIDPEYVKLHAQTMEIAQAAARYRFCDSPRCCVRFGCENTKCRSSEDEDADDGTELCHRTEKCANINSHFDHLLKEWFDEQKRAVNELYEKIPKPINSIIEYVTMTAFGNFMKSHLEQLPKKGPKRKDGMSFWMNWAKCKSLGHSDVLFMDNWKIQHAKDRFTIDSIEAATTAEMKWGKILAKRYERSVNAAASVKKPNSKRKQRNIKKK
jgi:hypothetical protein